MCSSRPLFLGIVAAVRPELLTSQDPNAINAHAILVGPELVALARNDEEGSDVLARIIYGTRWICSSPWERRDSRVGRFSPSGHVAVPRWCHGLRPSELRHQHSGFPLILFAVLIVASFGASLLTLIGILAFLFTAQVFTVARAQAKACGKGSSSRQPLCRGSGRPLLRRICSRTPEGPVLYYCHSSWPPP